MYVYVDDLHKKYTFKNFTSIITTLPIIIKCRYTCIALPFFFFFFFFLLLKFITNFDNNQETARDFSFCRTFSRMSG